MRRSCLWILLLLSLTMRAAPVENHFIFDPADEIVPVNHLDNPLVYDAGVTAGSNGLWVAWLEYVPGTGDHLWVGQWAKNDWLSKKQISRTPGEFAQPTPVVDSLGRFWISYERAQGTGWSTVVEQMTFEPNGQRASSLMAGINHHVTPGVKGDLFVALQQGTDGKFKATASQFTYDDKTKHHASRGWGQVTTSGNAWSPSLTITPDGVPHLICDTYEGDSYDVLVQRMEWGAYETFRIAGSPSFEAHARIASGQNGKVYVLWEEDGETWGKHYLARTAGDKKSTRMDDKTGPLHRFRRLHFGELDVKAGQLKEYALPQPSFDMAAKRTNAPSDFVHFGVFYERGQLVVDGQNRPWIVYRHSYVPWIGLVSETHKQDNMKLYARCLLPNGWSKLYSFKEGQGDGMQRIHVAPLTNGIAIAYSLGRTDRRKNEKHDWQGGVAIAEIHHDSATAASPAPSTVRALEKANKKSSPSSTSGRASAEVGGKKFELLYGDMHRHTDISLCFSPCDGTIDDAYRYAIDAGALDFLGITDHTHDLAMGDGLSLIWHRSRKEVNRHSLGPKFIPLFSYERSRGDTDHNVFSLRNDFLKPHTYPLSQFWEESDTNTFTVAHQPFNAVTWNYKDDIHRPLVEVYQGFRDDAKEEDAKQGLLRGHHFGFIASSDHLSTSASYACVWAEKADRETLFRAMQSRRTYAATSKIELRVMCGDHWMGERFEVKSMGPIEVFAKAPAQIKDVIAFVDGEPQKTGLSRDADGAYRFHADKTLTGAHIFHVRVTTADGNRAWSSPMWIDIKP